MQVINHREFVLFFAVFCGLAFGEFTSKLADISIYALGFVMIMSTTSFTFRSWIPLSKTFKQLGIAMILNYVILGGTSIALAYLLFPGEENLYFRIGFILIAAAPPGPSIIPYSALLKGKLDFAITTVIGGHLLAIVLSPLIISLFLGNSMIDPLGIVWVMVKLVLVPIAISRLLRAKTIYPKVQAHKDNMVKWGLFLVITPIVGLSRDVFFSHPDLLLKFSIIFIVTMYVVGFGYAFISKKRKAERDSVITSALTLVIKSSAFAAVTALEFFDEKAAMPAAVLSVFVTLYAVFFSMFIKRLYR
jgi:BASS family bile acid:Na+ symporter